MHCNERGVGIKEVETIMEGTREYNVVVGTKGGIWRLDPRDSKCQLRPDSHRRVVDLVHDIQPRLTDQGTVLGQHRLGARVEHSDGKFKTPRGQISELTSQVCVSTVSRDQQGVSRQESCHLMRLSDGVSARQNPHS